MNLSQLVIMEIIELFSYACNKHTAVKENLQLFSELQREQCYGVLLVLLELLGELKFLSHIQW